ncbi:MAG: orotidine-5'-phosphate decarboxylase [Patescibacteria group bacterium]|nr:orotidine-5'-phosphate decarboxylase [Patescibacteria group bacterium]
MLETQWSRGNFVCVGLDSEFGKIPESTHKSGHRSGNHHIAVSVANTIVAFNRAIVEATKDLVCAYKPNIAFYEAHGDEGLNALHRTIVDIHAIAPDVPVILDAKRADIGNTNAGYVEAAFDFLGADAITVHPYLGAEALQPFLDCKDKGIIVLCRTSNPGAGEFQDLHTLPLDPRARPEGMTAEAWLEELCEDSMRLYERVALNVATKWNKNSNCLLVVGATYPVEAERVRVKVGDVPFLIPGIGAQGGDVEATVMASQDSRGWGMIINSSRGIIFASEGADFAEAARRETEKLRDIINQYR